VPEPPVLECRDVSAGHQTDGGVRVVFSGATFAVFAGRRTVVIGGSGAGKSTLLRLLNRLEEPLSGTVLFHGRPLTGEDPLALRRKVALVLQKPVMFEGTVADNLRTRPRGLALPDDARLAALLDEVGLSADFMKRAARGLSVGEQQRVSFARALVAEPEVLLLDEPTSALDPRSLAKIADVIVGLAERRSLAVVAVTHQPELVNRLSPDGRDVLLLDQGRVRTGAAAAEIETYFGAP
jgi:putative ABC transport system ATP-binding protein